MLIFLVEIERDARHVTEGVHALCPPLESIPFLGSEIVLCTLNGAQSVPNQIIAQWRPNIQPIENKVAELLLKSSISRQPCWSITGFPK
jgi:hypothetical protein